MITSHYGGLEREREFYAYTSTRICLRFKFLEKDDEEDSVSKVTRLSKHLSIAAAPYYICLYYHSRATSTWSYIVEQHVSIWIFPCHPCLHSSIRRKKSLFMLVQILKSSLSSTLGLDLGGGANGKLSFRLDILSHFKIGKSSYSKSNIKFYALKMFFASTRLHRMHFDSRKSFANLETSWGYK